MTNTTNIFNTVTVEDLSAVNFDELLDTSVAKVEKAVASVDLSPVTLDEIKQAVESYGNLLQQQEQFKKTKSRIPALSFGTDGSLQAFSKSVVGKMLQAGVWPVDSTGKPLNVVKARISVAGKLFNRLYSLASQRGVVATFGENGSSKFFIKVVGKKDFEELEEMLYFTRSGKILDRDNITSVAAEVLSEVVEAIKGMTPMQRRQIVVDYLATQVAQEAQDNE